MRRIGEEGADAQVAQKKIAEKAAGRAEVEKLLEARELELSTAEKNLASAKEALEVAVASAKLFAEQSEAAARLSSAQQKLSGMRFDEAAHESCRKQAEGLRVEQARAETLLRSEEKQLALLRQMLELEGKALAELRQSQALAESFSQAAQSMSIYKNSLSSVQSELRSALVDEINQALAEVWPSVYPYGDYAGVKLEADEKDYRLLMHKGEWAEVDSVASGGERACLCLALRIAFATVLTPDLSWLILDEPTHNLDSDAVMLLSEAIREKIPSIVEQTFVITHDSSLGEAGQGNAFRLERDKTKNEPTRVEKLD
jgi:exonuclease SbcC